MKCLHRNWLWKIINLIAVVVLTTKLGIVEFQGHTETWYDLPMQKVVQDAQQAGIPCEYWVRDDGVKMFGNWVIVASHPSVTKYTFIETSLGTGIILDRHEMDNKDLYDIATNWKE